MSVASRKRLLAELKNKKYREVYAAEHVKTMVPIQNRILREQREWSQGHLAERMKTTQSVISRLEDPNYGKLSLSSLLKLAAAYDVALLVKFVPFSRLLHEFEDASPQALAAKEFMEELPQLAAWANESHDTNMAPPDAVKPRFIFRSNATEHYPLPLPAPGESFALPLQVPQTDFPAASPVVLQEEGRVVGLSTHESWQGVSSNAR